MRKKSGLYFVSGRRLGGFSAGLLVAAGFTLAACGESEAGDAGSGGAGGESATGGASSGSGSSPGTESFTGTLTFGGETLDCAVTTSTFTSDEFSIICDNDEDASNYRYVEVTFKDEASARTAQDLVFAAPFDFTGGHDDPKAISVGWTDSDGTLYSADDSSGEAAVTESGGHNVVTLTDVSLSNAEGTATGTVSATLSF
jgi:hypothetical protein